MINFEDLLNVGNLLGCSVNRLPYNAGHSTPPCIVPPLKNFIELYNTRGGIIQLSRDPVIRFESSFFCLIALIELFKIKKRSFKLDR